MPFDYNSYLQGVQTGLRLGRTTPGRKPPIPSGRYILTESGAVIVTEHPVGSEATLYSSDLWYDCAETPGGLEQVVMFKAGPYHTYEENEQNNAWIKFRYFLAYLSGGPSITYQHACCVVLFSFDPEVVFYPYPGTMVFQFWDYDYSHYSGFYIQPEIFTKDDCHGGFIVDPYKFEPQPKGTQLGKPDFSDGIVYQDAVDYAWGTQFGNHLPLITEGG